MTRPIEERILALALERFTNAQLIGAYDALLYRAVWGRRDVPPEQQIAVQHRLQLLLAVIHQTMQCRQITWTEIGDYDPFPPTPA